MAENFLYLVFVGFGRSQNHLRLVADDNLVTDPDPKSFHGMLGE